MVSSQEVRNVLDETGISQKRCSQKTSIPLCYLNEFIHEKRLLSQEHMIRLANYIEKVKVIV